MWLYNIFGKRPVLFHHFNNDGRNFAGITLTEKGNLVVFDYFFIPYHRPFDGTQKLLGNAI